MTNDTIANTRNQVFDRPVILERKPYWSSIIVWAILGITSSGVAWACWAKIEQVIPSAGKLEPKGAVVEVKAPTGGVVKEVLVKGGDLVKENQVLLTFDPTAPAADVESLRQQRELALEQRVALNDRSYILSLENLRSQLKQDIEADRAELSGLAVVSGGEFGANLRARVRASRSELDSRIQAAQAQLQELQAQLDGVRGQLPVARRQLEIAQEQLPIAQRQLDYARQQIPGAREQLENAKRQVPTAEVQLETARRQLPTAVAQLEISRDVLAVNEGILNQIKPVVEEGAVSKLQERRQQQEVLRSETEVAARQAEILEQMNQISAREVEVVRRRDEVTAREGELLRRQEEIEARQAELGRRQDEIVARGAEIDRLRNEDLRLREQMNQARAQLSNTRAGWEEELLARTTENQKRLAEVEVQLQQANQENDRAKRENDNRISQIDAQLTRSQLQLQYQELRAPVAGFVFDLQPNSTGFVARETEPILKIVRDAELEASVFIQNKDVALVLESLRKNKERFANGEQPEDGVPVEVTLEAFPASEYGTVRGVLTSVAEDVLPPNPQEGRNFFAFPATITLQKQEFELDSGVAAKLRSGMAVQANIEIGKRTVMQIFLGRLTRKAKSLESVK
ncbi:MAG: HlyD family efflux transporter periplasmic adaptor subunit [Oscillatoria sp. SIO1A7]|nr:HlyD family efflux transporter periplasmic adaptor subunit [Oscillatoria sp. SIO1A7]